MAEKMKVTLTKGKCKQMFQVVERLLADPRAHRKLAYAIGVNQDELEKVVKNLAKAEKPSKEFAEYDQKRIEACQEFADKDDKGKPLMVDNSFVIIARKAEFDAKLEEVRGGYKEAIDERTKQLEQMEEVYEEEVEVEFYRVQWKYVPRKISGAFMRALHYMIEGEPPEDDEIEDGVGSEDSSEKDDKEGNKSEKVVDIKKKK